MHFSLEFMLLFSVATAVALAARRLRMPYTVALVLAGLGLGAAHAFRVPHLTRDLLYSVFLPGLLFEAAFHLEFRGYWKNRLAIHALAVPGLVLGIVLTAAILTPVANTLHFVGEFRFVDALTFGAIIAATDPIAVVGLFRSLGAPRRLRVLVEGESLVNDGTSIVLFTIIVAAATGAETSTGGAVVEFIRVVGMGIAIGGAIGYIASQIIKRVDDPMIEITLTVIAAYGSFLAAEHFHYSGVIATVTAGMLGGNYAARVGMRPTTRVAVETFWEYVAFALNSVVFLLIGFEVRIEELAASWLPILAAYVAVLAARAAVVFGVSAALRPTRERLAPSWSTAMWWSGLRGALSMVLVLGLPASFPHRALLLHMTFGVVVLTILVQGLSMAPLLRRLGLVSVVSGRESYELERGRLLAARAALQEIERIRAEGSIHADVLERLGQEYERRREAAHSHIRELHQAQAAFREEEERIAQRHLLNVEKDAVLQALHRGAISQGAQTRVSRELDERLMRIQRDEEE